MDRDTYLRRLGDTIEPGGRDPAPVPLRLVQKYVNTYNHELDEEHDRLLTSELAHRWLVRHALIEPATEIGSEQLEGLKALRELLRSLVTGIPDVTAEQTAPVPVLLEANDGRIRLAPTGGVVERVSGALLALVHEAMLDGTWDRMKGCRQCSWVFYDRSRNRSGGWCSMNVCGNRVKNRSYRERASGSTDH